MSGSIMVFNILNCQRAGHRFVILILLALIATLSRAADNQPAEPQPIKHRVAGLFSPDRQDDLRQVMKKLPDLKLISIDYKNAEATFSYDPAKLFPGAKPEQIVERFDKLLRSASFSTFAAKFALYHATKLRKAK